MVPSDPKLVETEERSKMKRVIVVAVLAISFVGVGCNTASAAGRSGRAPMGARMSGGPIAKLIELERRKNAALRRMFFGS